MTTKNILNNIVMFTVGAAVGSAVTWKIVKTKYEKIAQEEIDSVKAAYAPKRCECENECDSEPEQEENHDEEMEEYENLVEQSNYATESNTDEIQNDGEDVSKMDKPYVISPEEFDDCEYEKITLHYYANDVIVDGLTDGVVDKEDWEEMVGLDFAEHFGDYPHDPDTVYVRNDDWLIAYEILKELDDYPEDN